MPTIHAAKQAIKMANDIASIRKAITALEKASVDPILITIHTLPAVHLDLHGDEKRLMANLLDIKLNDLQLGLEKLGFSE